MQINLMPKDEFLSRMSETFGKIALTYGLNEPGIDFLAHMGNCLRKFFGTLTIEQIDDAFERNAVGALNDYLPRNGFGKAEATVKFTIPDVTKVIKAYVKFKKLDAVGKMVEQEIEIGRKDFIRKEFCRGLYAVFTHYARTGERMPINTPGYVCKILVKYGLVKCDLIDQTDITAHVPFLSGHFKENHNNIRLIFDAFDAIIGKGLDLEKLLSEFYAEHEQGQLPIFDTTSFQKLHYENR